MSLKHDIRDEVLEGPILRTLLKLAWPVIISNLVNISYNLVDAFWLGKLGRRAFGAPTVSWPLIMLFYAIGMGFSLAGITLITQYYGSGNELMTSKSASQLVSFMGMMAISLAIIGYLVSPKVLKVMGVPEDVYPLALKYIRIIFIGIPIVFMGFTFIAIANSLGDTRTPMYLNIASSTTNIVLDPILIFGYLGVPRLGVIGAAIATIASRSIVSIAGMYKLVKGYRGIRLRLKDMKLESWWLRKVVSIGTPMAIHQSSTALGFTVMMSIVSRFGSVAIAAYGVAIRVVDVLQAFTWGINRATTIMIGQNIGAGKYLRARAIARKSTILVITTLSLGSSVMMIVRNYLVEIFVNDPKVIIEGSKLIEIFAPSIPFFGIFSIGSAVATGSGHTRFFALASIIRLWVLRVGLSILLAISYGLGTLGIWLSMSISNICAGLMVLLWTLSSRWARKVI